MDAEVTAGHHSSQGETIECVHVQVVGLLVVLVKDLLSEAVVCGTHAGLVVAPQQVNSMRRVQLEGEQHHADLVGENTAVDVVSKEQVVRKGVQLLLDVEHAAQIIELAVQIANDGAGASDFETVWLLA